MPDSRSGIEILQPQCNPLTVYDGRGGIFSWVPQDDVKEFNIIYFKPGKSRGNHLHPEFHEYFLVVDGEGVMATRDPDGKNERVVHMGKGSCVRTPQGTPHAFYAITEVTAVAMLTKPWDACDEPIVRLDVIDPEYFNPV